MLKRVIINLLLIFFVIFCLEIFAFFQTKEENGIQKHMTDRLKDNDTISFKTKYTLLKDFNTSVYRKSFIKEDTNKLPLILFGCSFAEGAGLKDEQTPCFKLSELTRRTCINQAKGAVGTQYMYYRLTDPKFAVDNPKAHYIIYVFIWNHLQRLYNYQVNPLIYMYNLRYKLVNKELVQIHPAFKIFYSSFLVKRIQKKLMLNNLKEEEYNFHLFNKIMSESLKITKKNYPDSKFILLEFPDRSFKELPPYEVKKLKTMGFDVVKVTDITKGEDIYEEKYWLPDEIHPSEKLWDLVLPVLVKEHLSE